MSNFDIGTLSEFRPPRYFCEKCKCLLFDAPIIWEEESASCPVCGVIYMPTNRYEYFQVGDYLDDNSYGLKFKNIVQHGQQLAAIAHNFNRESDFYPPMRALFEGINLAQQFVHFTSFGLSHMLFGALKLKAQSIAVRGIASNIHPDFVSEIKDHKNEAKKLEIRVFERSPVGNHSENIPHQKLVVIDGLIAFKGAANLTIQGWRKAAEGRDHIEMVTNIQEVVKLHNKLFSPIWAEGTNVTEIKMPRDVPF